MKKTPKRNSTMSMHRDNMTTRIAALAFLLLFLQLNWRWNPQATEAITVQNISQEDKAAANPQADAQYPAGPTTDTHQYAQAEALLAEGQQQRTLLSPLIDGDAANDRTSEETEQQQNSLTKDEKEGQQKPTEIDVASSKQESSTTPPIQIPDQKEQSEQKESQQQQTQQEEHPHPKRNYASKECGAKVLYANEDAENRGAILNDPERDDYMRNPCEKAQNKFLIIELCETIQPTSLDIANFELFSSNPKNFRLWGSERYPTQDWSMIGEFEAQDNRGIQTFHVEPEHAAYAKFIKLELLTHHGKEHFCTLSTFRLYGTSMVDEYEAEASSSSSQQHSQQQNAPIEPILLVKDGRMGTGETMEFESAPPAEGVGLQRHKATPDDEEGDPFYEDYENNTAGDSVPVIGECNINDQQSMDDTLIGMAPSSEAINSKETQRQQKTIPEQQNLQSNDHIEDESGNTFNVKPVDELTTETTKDELVGGNSVLKTIVEIGTNLKQALHQAFANNPREEEDGKKNGNGNGIEQPKRGTKMAGKARNSPQYWRHSLLRQNPSSFCRLCPRNPEMRQCHLFCRTFFPQNGQISRADKKMAEAERRTKKARLEFLDRVLRRQTASFCPLPPATPMTCRRKSETAPTNGHQDQKMTQQQQQKPSNGAANGGSILGNGAVKQPSHQQQPVGQQQQHSQKPVVPNKVVDKANLRPLPGTSTNHKESVFMKLNKRLTALEQNMSLSSEHLSELSRKYGADEEKKHQQEERFMQTAERVAKQETQRVEQEIKQKMAELQREVRRLSQQLQAVTTVVQSGNGGFFYRPFLTPIHGYAASDGHHCTEQGCINGGLAVGTVPPLHSTSTAAFESMPLVKSTGDGNADGAYAKDGLWTTSQVITLIFFVQIGTLITLKLIRFLWNRLLSCSSTNQNQMVPGGQGQPMMTPTTSITTPTSTSNTTMRHQQQQLVINLNSQSETQNHSIQSYTKQSPSN